MTSIIEKIKNQRISINNYTSDLVRFNVEKDIEVRNEEKELKALILSHTFSRDEIIALIGIVSEDEDVCFENTSAIRIYNLLCKVIRDSEFTNDDGKLVIEISDEIYSNFYASSIKNQVDGWDRALWIDIADGRIWETCESKNTIIQNLKNTIFCVESVSGDNNGGVDSVCMDCDGCRDAYICDKKLGDIDDVESFMDGLYDSLHYGTSEGGMYSRSTVMKAFMNLHNMSVDEVKKFYDSRGYSWYGDQFDDCVMEYADINEYNYRFVEFERV